MIALWLAGMLDAQALTLDEAWTLALDGGEEAAILAEQARQARLVQDGAWGSISPKIVLGSNFTVNEREVLLDFADMIPEDLQALFPDLAAGEPTVIQKRSFFDANLTIVQPVLDARAFAGIGAAKSGSQAGAAQAEAGRADLRVGIARAFWGVLVARDVEQVAVEGLALAERHLVQARAVVEAGNALRQASLQAELAVSRAKRDLAAARAQVDAAEAQLAALVPASADALETLEEPVSMAPATPTLDTALTSGLASRPDLRAADLQARAAGLGATVSRLGWLPTLEARFTEAWSENTGFVGEPWNWQFALQARWTLWDGGYRVVDNQKASSEARMAAAAAERMRQAVEVEVRSAWGEVARARDALAAAEHELDLATENLRLTEVTFEVGASTFLDLEDARVGRDGARVRLLTERMNLHLGLLSLARATGSL